MAKISRVLLLSTAYLPKIGGSELAIKNITDRLPEIEFDLITSRFSKGVLENEKIGNVHVYRVGNLLGLFSFLLPKNFLPIHVFLKACELIRKKGPYDIIHAYQASQAAGGGWLLKWFYPRIPFLLTIQEGKAMNDQSRLLRLSRRLIFKKVDAATAISSYLADYVRSQNSKIPVIVIPNGVDIEKFKIQKPSVSFLEMGRTKSKTNEKIIITVSRLVEKNGIGDLVDAFSILHTKYLIQNIRLMIVGDGLLAESLKLKVRSLKLEDKVKFLGEISNDNLPNYLTEADVFVRPSLSEGLGNAFLEAMAVGLPVIGTPVGGIPDFLKDGETGLFCRAGDSEDIAAKIRIILFDDNLKETLTLNGRKLVEDKYDWSKIALKFGKIYNDSTI